MKSDLGARSDRTMRATIIGSCLTVALAIVGGVWALSGERARALGDIAATRVDVQALVVREADREKRLQILERTSSTMAADVVWIRKALEREYPK